MLKYLLYAEQDYAFAILRPLQRAILARGDEVAWFLAGDEITSGFLRPEEHVLKRVADVRAWRPDVVLVPGNVVPAFIPGLKVAVFHGFNARKRSRGTLDSHFALRGCFDLYCTQGPSTTVPFELLAAKHRYFSVVETGWPKVDPLFWGSPQRNPNERPIILLSSTFSSRLTLTPHLYEQVQRLSEMGRWQWLVTFHPKMSVEWVEKYRALENDHLQFIETDNIIPLLQQADVMVCDTSSILQEFLVLEKPVVTFRNRTPGPQLIDIQQPDELESAIVQGLKPGDDLKREISDYVLQMHPYRDGRSSERVLDAVEKRLSGNQVFPSKPVNLWRNLKARRQLNYFGWGR